MPGAKFPNIQLFVLSENTSLEILDSWKWKVENIDYCYLFNIVPEDVDLVVCEFYCTKTRKVDPVIAIDP